MVEASLIRITSSMKNKEVTAVFSDAHGNLAGLQKAFVIAEQHGANQFVYLGDAVGYIPSTDALEMLRLSEKRISFVKGNHEDQVLTITNPSSSDEIKKHSLIRGKMTQTQIAFVSSWPEKMTMDTGDFKLLFLHGSPEDPLNGYIYANTPLKDHPSYSEYNLIFVGNTHIPFIRKFGQSVIINVGSVGLPRDHGKVGSIALLNFSELKVKIIRYSIAEIQDEICQTFAGKIDDRVKDIFDRVSDYNEAEEYFFG